jgi:hypothetical protein
MVGNTISLPQTKEYSLALPYKKINEEFLKAFDNFKKSLNKNSPAKLTKSILSKPNTNTKLSKSTQRTEGYKLYSLFLAPAGSSGYNTCPWSSEECVKLCLNTSGRGAMMSVQKARIAKTAMMVERPYLFMENLLCEMYYAMRHATKNNYSLALRLNGTSDIVWESAAPFIEHLCQNGHVDEELPHIKELVKFNLYDYTKSFARASKPKPWYDFTLSYSGTNWSDCERVLNDKTARVAVVFSSYIPETYKGFVVVNGDLDDYRFLDKKGCIVGLKYKSTGKSNDLVVSGCDDLKFVVRN